MPHKKVRGHTEHLEQGQQNRVHHSNTGSGVWHCTTHRRAVNSSPDSRQLPLRVGVHGLKISNLRRHPRLRHAALPQDVGQLHGHELQNGRDGLIEHRQAQPTGEASAEAVHARGPDDALGGDVRLGHHTRAQAHTQRT